MSSDFLKINSYVMDDVSGILSRSQNNFANVGGSCKSNFSVMKNGKLFNTGINKINSQFEDLISRLNYMNSQVGRNTNDFFELERRLNEEALAIEIPTDFEIGGSITEQNIKNISLSKNDGRSVNEGQALFDNTSEFDSNIASQTNLNNITNLNESKVNDINDYTNNNVMLNNINNNSGVDEEKLEEYKETEKISIDNIDNNRDVNEEKLDEYKETEKISINNIDNNYQTNTVNINDASIINKKELDKTEDNGGDN